MMDKVIATSNGTETNTNGFTIGKEYDVIGEVGNCLIVLNDNGDKRAVICDCPSPHIIKEYIDPYERRSQKSVGEFQFAPLST